MNVGSLASRPAQTCWEFSYLIDYRKCEMKMIVDYSRGTQMEMSFGARHWSGILGPSQGSSVNSNKPNRPSMRSVFLWFSEVFSSTQRIFSDWVKHLCWKGRFTHSCHEIYLTKIYFLFELDGYAFWRQWSCKCFLSEGNSGRGDLIMMNFVTPGGGSVGKLHCMFCTASSISHPPISCKMKCTCPPYCIRKAVLASGFPPGEKGSFTSKVNFLLKSLSVYVYLK